MRKILNLKKTIMAGVCAAVAMLSYAQDINSAAKTQDSFLSDYVIRNWTSADGLPGMAITDIIQDHRGYIYIGTYDGLVRFDGLEFVNFRRNYDDRYDFVSVRVIFEDSDLNLWVGHNDEGVSCIDQEGNVVRYSTEQGLPNNSVRALCQDREGNIWVGTANGICYINQKREILFPNDLETLGEENLGITRLYCDTAGRIWLTSGRENGLFIYNNDHFEVYRGITKVKSPQVTVMTQDNTGAFWFGLAPYYAVRIKDTEETVYDLSHGRDTGTVFNSIYQDSNANIWFGMDCGVTILHEGKLTYFDKGNGLPDDKIAKIIEDREGNIWFSSDRGGIGRLSRAKFRTTEMNTSVNAMTVDADRGVMWIGTDDGLYCLKNDHYIENELTEMCRGIRIRHVGITDDKELLVSSYIKQGQMCLKPDDTIVSWTKETGLSSNKCRVAIKIKNGDYYIGTTEGLNIVDGKTGEITLIAKADGVKNDYIMCLYEDKEGKIWVGTDGGGIFILKDRQVVGAYSTDNGLCGNVVFKIGELKENEIWITTGTGISRYNESDDSFSNLDSANGLGTDGVFQLVCDYTRSVWMTSNRGISSVKLSELEDCADGKISFVTSRYFGKSEGLVSGGVTSTSLCATDTLGRIWFPLIDGYAMYNPVKVGKNRAVQKPLIQEFTIDNDSYEYDGHSIVLAPSAKRLSLKYTGLTFTSAEQMQFRYKLAGFEDDFSSWTSERSVSYTNLKPGIYYFTLIARNSDEVLSDYSDTVRIVKRPHFYQEVWFWLLVVIAIAGAIAGSINLKLRALKRKELELKHKVLERTEELLKEKEKSERLLLNILPEDVAKELTDDPEHTIAKQYPKATVLFADIVGFTKMTDSMTAEQMVSMLSKITVMFDERARNEGIEKIKTMGDAYMAACGLTENPDNEGALRMVKFAQGLLEDIDVFNRENNTDICIRVGINTGNLVAGVIGKTKFNYDIWGDTVNVASRMESSGEPKRIHFTESTYAEVKGLFTPEEIKETEIKGKGMMKTYLL